MAEPSPPAAGPKYRRVVLKISGEGFVHPGERGIAMDAVLHIARQTYHAAQHGVQIAIVIGGGNILRGAQFTSGNSCIHEATAHYMGMLATMINGLALQDALESLGCDTRLMTAIRMDGVAEPYIRRRARRHLEKGRIVILAGGTGNPFFTTDTCAALRANELEAEVLLKATKVDGVYSDDPQKDPKATRYSHLTYDDVLRRDLKIIDGAAIVLCKDNHIPIIVFNLKREGNIRRVIAGKKIGTRIGD